jgi:hypothetical protein
MSKNQEEKENMPPPLGAVPEKENMPPPLGAVPLQTVWITGTLSSIDSYSKLIISNVKSEIKIKSLLAYTKSQFNEDDKVRVPTWEKKDGSLAFKLTVPKFSRNAENMFNYQSSVGKKVNFKCKANVYDGLKFGKGVYFELASPLRVA